MTEDLTREVFFHFHLFFQTIKEVRMSFTRSVHHIVFSTKRRKPYLREDIHSDLFSYIGGIVRKRNSMLMEAGGVEDHVHLLVSVHQSVALADLVRDIKSGSSRWIHDEHPGISGFSWQTKYGAFSVSCSMEEKVRQYILGQKEHHRKKTFQEEFRSLLDHHGFSYDERYMWE